MIRAVLGILGLGMTLTFTPVQSAVVAPDSAFATFYSRVTAPGKQTISFGSNGTPVVAPGVPSLATAGGPVQVSRTGSLALPSGARLPITATSKISNVAISALVKKALPLVPYLGTGVALWEMATELGFDSHSGPDGVSITSTATKEDFSYSCFDGSVSSNGLSCIAALQAIQRSIGYPNCTISFSYWAGSAYFQGIEYAPDMRTTAPGCPNAAGPASRFKRGDSLVTSPASLQDVADAISIKSAWPSGSAVSQALVDAARITGEQIPTDQPSITGPASVAGPVSVSTTPYQDMVKKSTKASNYDCSYVQGSTVMEGGSAICTERSVTTDEITKTDPATGNKTTTSTISEDATKPADIPKDQEQVQASDTPLPSQPTLYKRQYPDGLTGVWTAKKASLTSSPLIQLTTSLQPTIAAPSGYPSWPILFVIGSKNWGTFDVSPAPYIWDFLKVCTILGALFLARALIFGG